MFVSRLMSFHNFFSDILNLSRTLPKETKEKKVNEKSQNWQCAALLYFRKVEYKYEFYFKKKFTPLCGS